MNCDSVMDSSVSRNMRFLNSRMACPSRALPFLGKIIQLASMSEFLEQGRRGAVMGPGATYER